MTNLFFASCCVSDPYCLCYFNFAMFFFFNHRICKINVLQKLLVRGTVYHFHYLHVTPIVSIDCRLSLTVLLNILLRKSTKDDSKSLILVIDFFYFQFIPWKKKYFLLKNGDSSSEDDMIKLLDENGLLDVDLFPRNLAR